jgi:outer membrane receptor protein involved in Fe transport
MAQHRKASSPPTWTRTAVILLCATAGAASARADADPKAKQPAPTVVEQKPAAPVAEVPIPVMAQIPIEDMVVSAMKTETSVQEAPGIVSVLTGDQIKSMGYRDISDAIGGIPGFQDWGYVNFQATSVSPRGINQGALVLMNGLDLTNRGSGWNILGSNFPVEMIRRVELISGPGGVLWGNNSFVGVINMVSKTADDLQGVEAYAGWGTGPGHPDAYKAYAIGGAKFWKDRLKVLVHVSYNTYRDFDRTSPYHAVFLSFAPNPSATMLVTGPDSMDDGARSHFINHEGNIQFGNFSVNWSVPWQRKAFNVDFPGNYPHNTLGEDAIDCTNPANKSICSQRVDPSRISRVNYFDMFTSPYASLGYHGEFLNNKLRIDTKAGYIRNNLAFERYVVIGPSSLVRGGAVVMQKFTSHRVGVTIDGDAVLPRRSRILFGGEVYYDWMPENIANFDSEVDTLKGLPFRCPRDSTGALIKDASGQYCPLVADYDSNRVTTGLFVDAQSRVLPSLMLEGGGRLQVYAGKRSMDPVGVGSGGAVWTFLPNWNAKVQYTMGIRPPDLHKTDANGDAVTWGGNPYLQVEQSKAVQGEINTRVLQDYKGISRLGLRADYSYTWITNMLGIQNGLYYNSDEMGIHCAEFLADLVMKKGHWVSLGYTFLDMNHSDKGKMRGIPNQWFSVRALVNLFRKQLYFSTNLSLISSIEDYNKIPNATAGSVYLGGTTTASNGTITPVSVPAYSAKVSDMVVDRYSPSPLWNAKIYYQLPKIGLRFDLDVYNILNAKTYEGDYLMDQTAFLEYMPVQRPGISFFLSAQYAYAP